MDKLSTLFQKDEYKLPIIFHTDNYKEEVHQLLTQYIEDLTFYNVDTSVIEQVKQFRRSCMYTISNYLKGIHSNAFENFEKGLSYLNIIESKLTVSQLDNDVFYRCRSNKPEENKDYDDSEMYHIPLNKRGIIDTQRYSFPGLPCIYGGASVYTCWIELNRPMFDYFQVATIVAKTEGKKVLDLSHVPQQLKAIKEEEWFQEEDYFLYWPLLALCSIKVRNEKNSFKPEYIFPQFLLEYILKKKNAEEYVGIKYASVKVASINRRQYEEDWHTFVNYVFPTRSDRMDQEKCGFLEKHFEIQKNRSGKELRVLESILEIKKSEIKTRNNNEILTIFQPQQESDRSWRIYTRDGKTYQYSISVFGMIEEAMITDDFSNSTFFTSKTV